MSEQPVRRPRVEVTIDELVVHGYDASSSPAIGAAVEAELARQGLDGRVPADTGAAVAQAVHQGADGR